MSTARMISIHPPHAGRDFHWHQQGLCLRISIHPPHAGRDAFFCIRLRPYDISIHPPHAGRDPIAPSPYSSAIDFNPPSPCGEGLPSASLVTAARSISIHPPHAGRDYGTHTVPEKCTDFNPPSPCGEGLYVDPERIALSQFQSTLPMRGGTAQVHKIYLETYAHITKQAIYTGTYSEAFKVFPHIMAYFAVFFYANLPGNLCLLPLRIIK